MENNIYVGNIELSHYDPENLKTLSDIFDALTERFVLTPEVSADGKEHYHFIIHNLSIKLNSLKDKIKNKLPYLKQSKLNTDKLNKDGTKKGWERRLQIKQPKPTGKLKLPYSEELEIIIGYQVKDIYKDPQLKPIKRHYKRKALLELKNRYWELIEKKHKHRETKKTPIQYYIEAINKENTFMNACGKEEIKQPTKQQILDFVFDKKYKNYELINERTQTTVVQTLILHFFPEHVKDYKNKIKDNLTYLF